MMVIPRGGIAPPSRRKPAPTIASLPLSPFLVLDAPSAAPSASAAAACATRPVEPIPGRPAVAPRVVVDLCNDDDSGGVFPAVVDVGMGVRVSPTSSSSSTVTRYLDVHECMVRDLVGFQGADLALLQRETMTVVKIGVSPDPHVQRFSITGSAVAVDVATSDIRKRLSAQLSGVDPVSLLQYLAAVPPAAARSPPTDLHIFVDWSNIAIGAQSVDPDAKVDPEQLQRWCVRACVCVCLRV
jgi:hypothetical protein